MDRDSAVIEYVKEKDSLKTELKEKDQEILKQRSKIYDLTVKIDEIEKQMKALKSTHKKSHETDSECQENSANKSSSNRQKKHSTKSSKSKSRKSRTKNTLDPSNEVSTPNISIHDEDEENNKDAVGTLEHLKEVAAKYPDLKLSVIFEAERVFKENDVNNDGIIDEQELEKMLEKQGHLYTKKELKDIIAQIDLDNSQSIDIMEYLAVMERVQQRKRVNLPSAITRSAACFIQ